MHLHAVLEPIGGHGCILIDPADAVRDRAPVLGLVEPELQGDGAVVELLDPGGGDRGKVPVEGEPAGLEGPVGIVGDLGWRKDGEIIDLGDGPVAVAAVGDDLEPEVHLLPPEPGDVGIDGSVLFLIFP